uniref:Uncharacterized protein n=1 Tax=Myoviridae sp. ctkOm7 TaxID=2826690 RepID=A0A8S5NLX6_9CAUD|nr:MAG TPA: hypothetical protein [Myoviridae sp. ctkOm7]
MAGTLKKKPGTNPRPLSYISPQRAFAVLMRIYILLARITKRDRET